MELREQILQCNPLQLLLWTQFRFHANLWGTTSEFQRLSIDDFVAERLTEYVQSVYVSNEPFSEGKMINEEDFWKIENNYKNIQILICRYYLGLSALYKKKKV